MNVEERALHAEIARLREVLEWLVSLDDPDPNSVGFQARRTIRLGQIIDRSREALFGEPTPDEEDLPGMWEKSDLQGGEADTMQRLIDKVAMPEETLAQRIQADGEMFRAGYEEGLGEAPEERPDLWGLIETAKATGCAVEIAGVRVEPCDPYGRVAQRPTIDRTDLLVALARSGSTTVAQLHRQIDEAMYGQQADAVMALLESL